MIRTLKYRFLTDAAEPLATLLAGALLRGSLPLPDLIIPVPLHPRRLRFRGFNQSLSSCNLLAEKIVPGNTLLEPQHLLVRTRFYAPTNAHAFLEQSAPEIWWGAFHSLPRQGQKSEANASGSWMTSLRQAQLWKTLRSRSR
ncbi:MAG: hypothetical protein WDN67_00925 [Candidatus Moraniibacteriota bacterium]